MRFGLFVQKSLSEPNGTPSNKRLISTYACFVYSIILLSSFFFGLPLNETIIHMADVFLGTAMGTYVVGRFAEKGGPETVMQDEDPGPVKADPPKEDPKPVAPVADKSEDEDSKDDPK
jgi:hypothetical protein